MAVLIKSVKARVSSGDGMRVLVERQWPVGISKDRVNAAEWLREIGPSEQLSRWFRERPTQWPSFRKKYLAELSSPEAEAALERLHELAASQQLTLLYAVADGGRTHARILKEILDGQRKPPSSTGPARAAAGALARRAARPK